MRQFLTLIWQTFDSREFLNMIKGMQFDYGASIRFHDTRNGMNITVRTVNTNDRV